MEKAVTRVALALALFLLAFKPAGAAEEPKGLAPGWLSLDSSVGLLDKKIEEGKGSIEKALGISISGFLDTSYTWSSNRPGRAFANDISGRYFDQDHNDVVFNFFNLTIEKPEKDWGVGFKLVGDLGRSAELLREATLWSSKLHRESSAELREAFLTFTIPIGEGLQVKGGKFVTLQGTEIIPAPGAYNDNISRSFMFNFAIPFTHTGALLSYPVLKTLTVSAGPVTGWDNPHDNNSSPSLLAGINFTPADVFALASSIVYGPEQRHKTGPKRFTWSNVATIKPMDPLTLFLEYTYGHEEKVTASRRDATWQGIAAIASYNWTDRFNTALRGEVFNDSDGVRLGTGRDISLGEITLTGTYKFTAKFLGRAEVRQDWADEKFFAKRNTSTDKSQTTLAFQLIYGF
jgi:hypothetical protein